MFSFPLDFSSLTDEIPMSRKTILRRARTRSNNTVQVKNTLLHILMRLPLLSQLCNRLPFPQSHLPSTFWFLIVCIILPIYCFVFFNLDKDIPKMVIISELSLRYNIIDRKLILFKWVILIHVMEQVRMCLQLLVTIKVEVVFVVYHSLYKLGIQLLLNYSYS